MVYNRVTKKGEKHPIIEKFISYTNRLNREYENMGNETLNRHIENWLKGRKKVEAFLITDTDSMEFVMPKLDFLNDDEVPFDKIGEEDGILWFDPKVHGILKVGVWGGASSKQKTADGDVLTLNAFYCKRVFGRCNVDLARKRLLLINTFEAFNLC